MSGGIWLPGSFDVLRATIAPWKIAPDHSGKLTKVFARRGKVSQYAYGTGYDTSLWRPGWQKGYVCSWWSGRIVMDRDADGFEELLERLGIPPSPVRVNTGRPGGYQLHYNGRGLAWEDWPAQRPLYAPDGTHVGDLKTCGFVPVPGSRHPDGGFYQMGAGAGGEGDELPWLPGYKAEIDADQEGLGHRCSGVDRGAEGWGRNCELYALKKRLFREEMIDEDDPRMAERILAANEEFRVPLLESEVWHTVLKIKAWVRHGHYNPEPLTYADLYPGGAPGGQAPQPAGRDVCPGSGISVPKEEVKEDLDRAIQASRYVKKCSDLRKAGPPKRLDTVARLQAKLKAEQDAHPRSADWAAAPPRSMEVYLDLAELATGALEAGAQYAQADASALLADPGGPWREQLEWLTRGNGAPLIEYHGGLAYLLSDPVAAEQPRYPGAPPGTDPKAGRSFGTRLDQLIVLIRSTPGGDQLTQREVARVINHPWFREEFGLREFRYVSVSAMSAHHVKQRKAGTVRIITPAVRYREGHIWHLDTAAVYRTGLRFGPGDELGALLAHGIVTALGGITRRARAAVPSPFEAAATEISLDGPQYPLEGEERE